MATAEDTRAGGRTLEASAAPPATDCSVAQGATGQRLAGWTSDGNRPSLWGWSPPPRPADTSFQRRIDRFLPRTGVPAVLFFAAVIGLLNLAPLLPMRGNLAVDGLAALAAGSWCALNFWRCRHAHCLVTGPGWLGLSGLAFIGAGLGQSLIGGDEQRVFLAVLVVALVFECGCCVTRGTNVIDSCWPAPAMTRR